MQKFVTIDSSVIVSALVENESRHQEALNIWGKVIDKSFFAILPFPILIEVVSAVNRRTNDKQHAIDIMNFILNLESIHFVDINRNRSIKSCESTVEIKTRGMDTIIIQVAKEFDTELITFDDQMMEGFKLLK